MGYTYPHVYLLTLLFMGTIDLIYKMVNLGWHVHLPQMKKTELIGKTVLWLSSSVMLRKFLISLGFGFSISKVDKHYLHYYKCI